VGVRDAVIACGMRIKRRCPKCDGTQFLVTEKLGFVQKMYKGQKPYVSPVPVAVGRQSTPGFFGTSTSLVAHGSYESWSCIACGYTELYANGLDEIAKSGAATSVKGDAPHPFR
jgi:predicted nucleic-acid-binding Zn-ribbon protein